MAFKSQIKHLQISLNGENYRLGEIIPTDQEIAEYFENLNF